MIVESLGRQTDQISIITVDEESFKTMFDIERCIETSDCTSSSLTSDEVIEMESKIYGPIISKEDDSDASMILEVNELINLCPSTPPPKRLRPHRMKKPKGGIAKLLYKDHMKWRVETLDARVDAELELLEPSLKARFLHICELLETFGPHEVGLPHVRFLVEKLWEIRMKGRSGIARAIYVTVANRRIVVVHAFVKKTQKTPRVAIETALDRAKELGK
jgi:phage-related protein